MNKKKCVIVDLDGTLCDLTHRLHLLPNYEAFEAQCHEDPVHEDVATIIRCIIDGTYVRHQAGEDLIDIIYCSGRSEAVRDKTEKWLYDHHLNVQVELYMRPVGDYRKDSVVKAQFLEHIQQTYDVLFCIDDRQQVVDMWREKGITCFQVRSWDDRKETYSPGKLTLLVGPSGAGKTTYLANLIDGPSEAYIPENWIISTDYLRQQLSGNIIDQTKNTQIFAAAHAMAKARLEHGFNTVIDATNIRNKDRLAFVDLVPGVEVTYVVIDRPLEQKLRDRGWRTEELVRRHHTTMQSNIKDILKGDNRPNVTVIDKRSK